jgi:hypothetical protein
MLPCKEWTGSRTKDGYGQKWHQGKLKRVHRIAWEEHYGPIPDGMFVCHHCDNPPCHEIAHLFLGTPADNTADMRAKGRANGGHVGNGYDKKTHCPQDHPYSGDNLVVRPGHRGCRECSLERNRKYYWLKKAAVR